MVQLVIRVHLYTFVDTDKHILWVLIYVDDGLLCDDHPPLLFGCNISNEIGHGARDELAHATLLAQKRLQRQLLCIGTRHPIREAHNPMEGSETIKKRKKG